MKPSIGRIVHFVRVLPSGEPEHIPGIITKVDTSPEKIAGVGDFERCWITCFNPDPGFADSLPGGHCQRCEGPYRSVEHNEAKVEFTWHWPEREE